MPYTRRDLGKIVLAATPLARGLANINSRFDGVQIGCITYCFRPSNDIDEIVKDMVEIGLGEAELMSTNAEAAAGAPTPEAGRGGFARGAAPGRGQAKGGPGRGRGPAARTPRPPMTEEQIAAARDRNKQLHDWRTSVSMDKFKPVRNKFETAGIDIRLLCFNMNEAITDEEIDYAFQLAKTLGAKAMSTTTQVSMAKRIAPFADKHKMMVGFHGHDATWDPNEFATPESFATAMALSKYCGVNLDIGHFTAAGYDAVAYIKEHHARITNLHLKDRKKDHGANLPWGQGDTPIKPVLLLLKDKKYPIPANIEYEYGKPGMDTVEEMKKCLQYCKDVLS
jgi:sugar phosphate isomerase/epimerase